MVYLYECAKYALFISLNNTFFYTHGRQHTAFLREGSQVKRSSFFEKSSQNKRRIVSLDYVFLKQGMSGQTELAFSNQVWVSGPSDVPGNENIAYRNSFPAKPQQT